jgi:hypothetical protein
MMMLMMKLQQQQLHIFFFHTPSCCCCCRPNHGLHFNSSPWISCRVLANRRVKALKKSCNSKSLPFLHHTHTHTN